MNAVTKKEGYGALFLRVGDVSHTEQCSHAGLSASSSSPESDGPLTPNSGLSMDISGLSPQST